MVNGVESKKIVEKKAGDSERAFGGIFLLAAFCVLHGRRVFSSRRSQVYSWELDQEQIIITMMILPW